jgi:hypothetical protein
MLHARPDYQHIQDPSGKIPEDEPVFLLRAQDKLAPYAIELWAEAAETEGADPWIVQVALRHAALMREWQKEHGSKVPDMP